MLKIPPMQIGGIFYAVTVLPAPSAALEYSDIAAADGGVS
jgi:hypothetical protein